MVLTILGENVNSKRQPKRLPYKKQILSSPTLDIPLKWYELDGSIALYGLKPSSVAHTATLKQLEKGSQALGVVSCAGPPGYHRQSHDGNSEGLVPVDLIAEELNYLAPLRLAGHQLDEADAVPGEQEAGSFRVYVMQLLAIPSARVHTLEDWTVEIL
jgi:hypothetical protein